MTINFFSKMLAVLLAMVINLQPVNQEDRELLAQVMYWENYCNGEEAMLLTGSVVLNRRDHCSWCPDTIKGVLYQKGQYSTTSKFFTKEIPAERKS